MDVVKKVVFNTGVLYTRIIISLLISLVSVPIVLKALGVSDYGLFSLVAGVISMLSFLNVSMNVATQRYLSVAIGERDNSRLNIIFNSAILLHLLIGLVIVFLFEICGLFIFDGFLNIPSERITAAKIVYQVLIINTFITVISVPYGAVINAKEDMLALSVFHIIKDTLKLVLALYLLYCPSDRLIVYSIGLTIVSVIYVLLARTFVLKKYKEFSFHPKRSFNRIVFRSMFSFAGWNTFGAVALIGRNQGIAVIFNLFYGTVINAAYGIANQLHGVISAMTGTFTQSINPQLMQSKGMDNEERLCRISKISSKYSFILFSLFSVPLIIEMSMVLKLWLGTIPEYTLVMSQLVLMLSMVSIYSNGLMSAIQATGDIARYQVFISALTLLNIPLSYLLLIMGISPYYCVFCFIIIEILCLIVRMFFAQKQAGILMKDFFVDVIFPTFTSVVVATIPSFAMHLLIKESVIRVIIVSISYAVLFSFAVWIIAINKSERKTLASMILGIRMKIGNRR